MSSSAQDSVLAKESPESLQLHQIQANASANKGPRDEAEIARGRLTDQKFDITKYPDPLAPRQGSVSQFFPQGVTQEMEARWLATIAASRDQRI